MQTLKSRLQSDFVRSTLMLMTGTGFAQVIPILFSPIFTRLYSPDHFGTYALFTAIATILSLPATGRYELAILLPKENKEAANIFALGLFLSFIFCGILFVSSFGFGDFLSTLLNNHFLQKWLPILPLMILVIVVYQSLNYWATREKKFKRLAINRVWLSLVTGVSTFVLGFLKKDEGGLILGMLIGQAFAAVLLGLQTWREHNDTFRSIRWETMKEQARKYSSFPKYSIAANLLNTSSNQLPSFLLTSFFDARIAGFFFLTQRVLAKPISLLADSVLEVFKQRASSDYASHGTCEDIFIKTAKTLFSISVIPFLLAFLCAPWAFTLVFGEAWKPAGDYARILSVMYFFSFTASPLSYVLYIVQKQKIDLLWQVSLLILTTAGIYGGYLLGSPTFSLSLYSAAYSLMYLIYALLSYRYCRTSPTSPLMEAEAI